MPTWRRRSQPSPAPTAPSIDAGPTPRPDPPEGANNLVFVVFDSLRHDTAVASGMPNMARLGSIQRRWSYASWTAPSHYNLLMGLLPHDSPSQVYASEHYKADFNRYGERLGIPGIEFSSLLPSLWLPSFLQGFGFRTQAVVSMPVLNRHTPVNLGFDSYELMPKHNDMGAIVDRLSFDDRPSFTLLNVGETHYPYATPDEDPAEWPRISGLHGVVKRLDTGGDVAPDFFDADQLEVLRARQVRAAAHVDRTLEHLYDVVPPGTWLVVMADHGELFGEAGYFGHGPIAHDKVFEVPFVEGRIR